MTTTQKKVRKPRPRASRARARARSKLVKSSSRTDFTIPIYPKHIEAIIKGEKDHEFRKYKLPAHHMWIYETAPISAIRYYAVISSPKTPEEMSDCFAHIERNRVFMQGQNMVPGDTATWYAHEIKEFYQLETPMTIKQLKQKGWLASHPQGLCWIPDEMRSTLSQGMIRLK